MASGYGLKLLQALLVHPKGTQRFITMGLREELFPGEDNEYYNEVSNHVAKFGALPKPETVGLDLMPDELEPPEYYLDLVVKRFLHRQISKTVGEVTQNLNAKDPHAALEKLRELIVTTTHTQNQGNMVEFSAEAAQIIDDEYKLLSKYDDSPGILTGYPTLDNMMGKLRGGDVMAVVGRPQQGKTYQLLRMAHHVWHTQQKRAMFLSMEMKPLPLIQRIVAIHQKMSVTLLRKGEITKTDHKILIKSLSKLENSHDKFWIMDGNLAARVEDIAMLTSQLKPDVLFIDGAYLLKTGDKFQKNWERIKDTIEFLKSEVSTKQDIPVVLSYQFNKEGAKAKDLENIGGSDAIGQIASVVLALYEKEEQKAANLLRKKVDIIKGRNGEQGEFYINWIFDTPPYMDFSEVDPVKDKDTQLGYI